MITEIQALDTAHARDIVSRPKFIYRVFSPAELKYLMELHFPRYIMAEMYAAKLAFKKCMAANFHGCKIGEVSVLRDYSGSYYVSLSGQTKRILDGGIKRVYVSCSHTKITTLAYVHVEQK